MSSKKIVIEWSDPAKHRAQSTPQAAMTEPRVWPKMVIVGASQEQRLPGGSAVTSEPASNTGTVNVIQSPKNWELFEYALVLTLIALIVWLALAVMQYKAEKGLPPPTRVRDLRDGGGSSDMRDESARPATKIKRGFSARRP